MLLSRSLALVACLTVSSAAQDVFDYEFSIDDFPNGLRLITVPTAFPDVVAIHVLVATGSRNEVEEGKSGFAHFFEHMMFRGTENYTSAEQAAIFKAAGADRNAYTTDDYTDYHTTVDKRELETVLRLEADRFQHLAYEQRPFRTEAMAVLGEYNKGSANPVTKLLEVVRDTAFDVHTYEHTTLGFLRDIRAMPRHYDYSREFFERWYKPEHTTILVVGDVVRGEVRALVDRYWGAWQRGSHRVEVPPEPEQTAPRECHVPWPEPTQPWVLVAFKGPAFSTTEKHMPAMDVIGSLAFSPSSELYRKLFVEERKVDALFPYMPDHLDPFLLMVGARLKDPADWAYVRDEILRTCHELTTGDVDSARLATVKDNLRYSFANGLDSSEAIASALAGYVARARTPAAVNDVYRLYEQITPADVRAAAVRYFTASGRTIATLSHEPLPAAPPPAAAASEPAAGAAITLPSASPLVAVRVLFRTGAADDPAGKEGLANLTARLIANGATRLRGYGEVVDALFPIAAQIGYRVDQEMTVFAATVHHDAVPRLWEVLREVLTMPAFADDDFERERANAISELEIGLRRADDEELGKEVLLAELFAGHPYRHPTIGTIEALRALTVDDVRGWYRERLTAGRLVLGVAGRDAGRHAAAMRRELVAALPTGTDERAPRRAARPEPAPLAASRMTIVEKETRATGLHIGFPIEVARGHPDWVALWLARSYLGEHRSENSHLYQRLREVRGLNYGDYAYIEYFPNGGQQFHPDPNLARSRQAFQIWIRPVPPENGPFALKAAWYELDKLVREGLDEAAFESTRAYLSKFVGLLVKTDDRRLGYALDSEFYGIGEFVSYVRDGLAALTRDEVHRAIRRHLRSDRLQFVVVTQDGAAFRDRVLGAEPTPIVYQAEPGPEVLAEDRIIERLRLPLDATAVRIVPVAELFVH